jgi:hypothetical protein
MEFESLSYKATLLIFFMMVNDQVFDSFIFWKVVLMFCHQSQIWSPTLKLGYFLQCSSTFYLSHLCAFKKLNTSCVQVFAKVSAR